MAARKELSGLDVLNSLTLDGASVYTTADFTLSDVARRSGGNTFSGAQSFNGNVGLTQAGSPVLTLETTANSAQQANLVMVGASTDTSITIAQLDFFNNLAGGAVNAAQVLVDGDGDINVSIGRLKVADALVWHANNDGTGTGLDADLLDGNHASAFAFLTGATFTGGVTATSFTGPGGGLTGLNGSQVTTGSVANARLASMTAGTVKGRALGSNGTPVDLTAAQLLAIIATVDGPGSGLDADTLDGDHASAFAKLTGAVFTGGVTATGFTGPGGGLTGVNAASLGGQAASAYALLSGATFTGTVSAPAFSSAGDATVRALSAGSGISAGVRWENGVNRLVNDDGGGNAHMYWGMEYNSGFVYTHAGGAIQWTANIDAASGTVLMTRVASNPGAGLGQGVTFDLALTQSSDFLRWGTNDIFHAGNLATGSDTRVFGLLGVGGATPDATNKFAFYGTDLLFNSGGSINLKFNKNAAGNDASLTFQSGFTTHGLVGLLANNDLTFKVGTGFTTAMVLSNADGTVSFPEGIKQDALTAYKTTSQTLTSTFAPLTAWTGTHVAASGNLSWSAANGDAYAGKAGRFLVSYSVSTEVTTGSAHTDSLAVLQRWNGTAWSDVAGTQQRMYNRLVAQGGTNAAWQGVLDLGASDGLRVAARREDGTDTVVVDSASLSVVRM